MINASSTDSHASKATSALSTLLQLAASIPIGLIFVLSSVPAVAKPEFAAKTGLPCGQCHISQTGAGPLKPFGEAFKANGYEVKKKK
jgi:hypothetical protein